MITRREHKAARQRAAEMMRQAGVFLSDREADAIEVVDFGLNRLEQVGLQVVTLTQTERLSVKVLVLFPNQTEPEHWHPPVGDDPGKEETIRVVAGSMYFYIPGENTFRDGFLVKGKEAYYTVRHEIHMGPGDQITLMPGTKHWFQAGRDGVVMYSFSTVARDLLDKFTDPEIVRVTKVVD
jgi:D-lyxose ketol-isomerase